MFLHILEHSRSKSLILLLQVVFDLPNLLGQRIQLTILGIITHHQCISGKMTRRHCNSGIVSASSSPTSLLNAKSMVSVDCKLCFISVCHLKQRPNSTSQRWILAQISDYKKPKQPNCELKNLHSY